MRTSPARRIFAAAGLVAGIAAVTGAMSGSSPKAGTYYILVHARAAVTGLTIRAQWLP